MEKIKSQRGLVALIAGGLLTSGLAILILGPLAAPTRIEATPLQSQDSEKVKVLLISRLEAIKTERDAREKEFLAGRGSLPTVLDSTARLLSSELEMCHKSAERVAAYQAHLDHMEKYRKVNQDRFDAGRIPIEDKAQTDYHRFDAEIKLERAKLP